MGFFHAMQTLLLGLREGGLTVAYNTIFWARAQARRLLRPTEMGVRALIARDDAILLVRHRGGRTPWGLPGGGIAPRESLAAAAAREAREESGCPVAIGELLGLYHSFGEGMNNYIAVFLADPLAEARPPSGDLEIVDAHFFRPRDIPAATEAGSLRRIAEYRRGVRGMYGGW